MSLFLDTVGNSTLGVGICARCSRKMPLGELSMDPNYPGLMVCVEDRDQYDPYRLPARQTERINLQFVRPDVPIDNVLEAEDAVVILITEDGQGLITEGDNYMSPNL